MNMNYLSRTMARLGPAVCLASTVMMSNSATADDVKCDSVSASAPLLVGASPVGPITGVVNFVIDGDPASAVVVITILGPPEVNPDGTQKMLASLQYTFDNGDVLNALGLVLLTPTSTPGAFTTQQQANYTGGTGPYSDVFGRVNANGSMSFVDLTATVAGSGAICRFKEKGKEKGDGDSDD